MIDARDLIKLPTKELPRIETGIDFSALSGQARRELCRRIRCSYQRWYYQKHKLKAKRYAGAYKKTRTGPQYLTTISERPKKDVDFSTSTLMQLPTEKFGQVITDILNPGNERIFAGTGA